MSEVFQFILHHKIWLTAISIMFSQIMTLSFLATCNYNANLPMQGEFYTNSQYVNENKRIFFRPLDPPGMPQTSS